MGQPFGARVRSPPGKVRAEPLWKQLSFGTWSVGLEGLSLSELQGRHLLQADGRMEGASKCRTGTPPAETVQDEGRDPCPSCAFQARVPHTQPGLQGVLLCPDVFTQHNVEMAWNEIKWQFAYTLITAGR